MDKFLIASKALLDDFSKITFNTKNQYRQTLMTVSGYPHLENVTSNILAFFFNDSEEHGFSNLWIRSLMEIIPDVDPNEIVNITVNREVSTLKGNRIDLTVYSDSRIIGIENKLFSSVHNDLNDYSKTIKSLATSNQLQTTDILLTLYDESRVAEMNHFINITYTQLFTNVRRHFGEYLDNANNTWITYAKDFMYTIENLIGGNKEMDKEMMQFVCENHENLGKLLYRTDTLKRELKKQTEQIRNLIESDIDTMLSDVAYSLFCYNERVNVYSSICVDMKRDNGRTITVETFCDFNGWHVFVFDRQGKENGSQEIKSILQKNSISFSDVYHESQKMELFHCSLESENDDVIHAIYSGVETIKKLFPLKLK